MVEIINENFCSFKSYSYNTSIFDSKFSVEFY